MDGFEFALALGSFILLGILSVTQISHYRLMRRIERSRIAKSNREFMNRFRR